MTIKNPPHHSEEYNDPRKPQRFPAEESETPLADELNRKLAQFRTIGREISAFINGFQFNVDRDHGEVKINLRRKSRPLVELGPLLRHCNVIHPLQSIIGWTGTQTPMVWSADRPQRHLLISGAPHSGKTGLLRSLLLTQVLASRPAKLQLAIIDGSCQRGNDYDHSELKRFSLLPHTLNRPPTNPTEVAEVIQFLSKEADHRKKHRIQTPQILLVIDNVEDVLPVAGPEFHQNLEHILDIGPETGICVILATNRPEDGRLQDLISGIELDRMVGKVHSAGQAAFATGIEESDAEYLDGNGEFLAMINQQGFHFQAAWVSDRLLNRYLKYLLEPKQPTLLAWDLFDEVDDIYEEVDEDFEDYEEEEDDEVEETEETKPHSNIRQESIREQQIYTRLNPTWLTDEPAEDASNPERQLAESAESEYEVGFEDQDEDDEFELEEEEHQLGWRTIRPFANLLDDPEEEGASEEDEDLIADDHSDDEEEDDEELTEISYEPIHDDTDDDEFDDDDLEPEDIQQHLRRTTLPRPKPSIRSSFKPIPKPSAGETQNSVKKDDDDDVEALTSKNTSDEESTTPSDSEKPFDPWQNGLDDLEDEGEIKLKNGFERPPRLAKKKPIKKIIRPITKPKGE